MESIITIATVLTMYFNAASDTTAPYLYNSDLEDGVIHKIEVYEQKADNQVCAKMEYRYDYDAEGRLSTKEIMRWDAAANDWAPETCLTYKYYKNGYNVEVSSWNAEAQAYDLPNEVTLYRSVAPAVTSVKTYLLDKEKNDVRLSNRIFVMEPTENLLLADGQEAPAFS